MLVITIITSTVCFAGVSAASAVFRCGARQANGTPVAACGVRRQGVHAIPMNSLSILHHRTALPGGPSALQRCGALPI